MTPGAETQPPEARATTSAAPAQAAAGFRAERQERRQTGPREVPWPVALAAMAQIALVVGLTALLAMARPPFVLPALVFVSFRLLGNLCRAFAGHTAAGTAIDGAAKAASWGVGGILLGDHLRLHLGAPADSVLWTTSGAIALAGLSLYGHHRRAFEVAPRLGITEAAVGAMLAAIATPIAASAFIPNATGAVVVGALMFVLAAALAATRVQRLVRAAREGHEDPDRSGWAAWWQERFFLHVLLVLAVVAWLVLRGTLRGILPLFVLFEYSAGIMIVAAFLLSLRSYLQKRLVETPVQSLHKVHEQAVERQGEQGFDDIDQALGGFLAEGDTSAVKQLGGFLERQGVNGAAHALRPLTTYRAQDTVALVPPASLYASRYLVFLALALALSMPAIRFESALAATRFTLVAVLGVGGLGLWTTQWNRFGGTWLGRPVVGTLGAASLIAADQLGGTYLGLAGSVLGTLGTAVQATAYAVLIGLPWLPLMWRGTRPPANDYASSLLDPLDAIERLRTATERKVVRRGVTLAIIAALLFVILGELGRFLEDIDVLFSVFLAVAFAIIVQPVMLIMALRLSRESVERSNEVARRERLRRHEIAMRQLEQRLTEHATMATTRPSHAERQDPPTVRPAAPHAAPRP